jgi:predicted nucleic acid-binding protein
VSDREWAVNASPLILLANVDCLPLLDALCAAIVVPAAVADEIRAGPQKDAAQRWLEREGQSHIRHLESIDPIVTAWDLGAGESAVLTRARQNPGYEAILDALSE